MSEIMKFRKQIRLKDYDYSTNGYYFVTMCCSRRAKLCLKYEAIIEKYLKNLQVLFKSMLHLLMADQVRVTDLDFEEVIK